jgi:phosphohistidine phosphatase SixA
MKIIQGFFLILLLSAAASVDIYAQNKTIILLRHAEKDVSPRANRADPELTPEGKNRAERLMGTIGKYNPHQIFSTIFKRTRDTAAPLAENLNPDYRLQIQFYDHTELEALAQKIMNSNEKSIVVVGHNTTTPELANLLIKQNKYKALDDSEYNKIWIIKIRGKKIEDSVIEY